MALTTTRTGRAGRWRTLCVFATASIAFSGLQLICATGSMAQVKAPSKQQFRGKSAANAAQPGDTQADQLNEQWLSEHNKREAAGGQQAPATAPAGPGPDDERVSIPNMAGPVGAGSRSVVKGSVQLVKATSVATAFKSVPGGPNLPTYKELTQAFSGFAPNGGKIEVVQGKTADGWTRLLYASIGDGKNKQTYWWFAPSDQPEGWFDDQGRRLGGTAFTEPRPEARISSPFGRRTYYGRRTSSAFHNGIDFEGKVGEPIFAAADGVINHQGWYFNYGRTVKISHADNLETLYAHMSRFADGVGPGSHVKKGDLIGYVGSTGRSTGPHLHFSAILNGQFVDPMPYISQHGADQLKGEAMVSFRQWQQEVRSATDAKNGASDRSRQHKMQGGEDWTHSPFAPSGGMNRL